MGPIWCQFASATVSWTLWLRLSESTQGLTKFVPHRFIGARSTLYRKVVISGVRTDGVAELASFWGDFPGNYVCKYENLIRLPPVNAELRDYMLAESGTNCLVAIPLEYDCESPAPLCYREAMSAERDEVRFEIPERLQDDPDLPGRLRTEYHPVLFGALISRGASPAEAEELLADLWGDCVGQGESRPSLLEKYSGKCPIRSWLATHRDAEDLINIGAYAAGSSATTSFALFK